MNQPIFCQQCGKSIRADSVFCRHCGTNVTVDGPMSSGLSERDSDSSESPSQVTSARTAGASNQAAAEPFPLVGSRLTSRRRFRIRTLVLIAILILVAGLAIREIDKQRQAGMVNGPAESEQSLVGDETAKEYIAKSDQFKIDFPGIPDIANKSIPYQDRNQIDRELSLTIYSGQLKGSSGIYSVTVTDYRNIPVFESVVMSLEDAFQGMVEQTEGAKLVSSKAATMGGSEGIEGVLTLPVEGNETTMYLRMTEKDLKTYGAVVIGADYSDFAAFANSFQFTN